MKLILALADGQFIDFFYFYPDLEEILKILHAFEPIGLKEMDRARLMNRTDTKYVIPISCLTAVLEIIRNDYFVLDIDGNRMGNYETQYFDTSDFKFYIQHHNGKKNRLKVRFRKYVDSAITFLEVKKKNNKDRTIKVRKLVDCLSERLDEKAMTFIEQATNEEFTLLPTVRNKFRRATLVSKNFSERATIDFGIELMMDGKEKEFPRLCIIESKQDLFNRGSKLVSTLKTLHWRSLRISKYCLGMAILGNELKTNNFKEKLMKLEKLENELAS